MPGQGNPFLPFPARKRYLPGSARLSRYRLMNCGAGPKRPLSDLREAGPLPAIVEADDDALYVMKFAGAGQGPKALIAELVAGEIGRALGLPVPEIVLMTLETQFGRTEADPEIRALLQASVGLNLGLRYLPKAFAFSPLLRPSPDPGLASAIVWFDAYVTNVDRIPRGIPHRLF